MIRTRCQGDVPFFPNMLNNGKVEVCLKEDVDKVIREKDTEIEDSLRQNRELCQALQVMYSKEEYGKLQKEIESLKASHYAEMVDAGMRERRLRRALFIAHAIKAKFKWWWMSECKHNESCKLFPDTRKIKKFTNSAWVCSKSQEKCRAKAEEYR